jgi:flavin reductase (DIM6/NTAB) family NADH-FMN oxidoreductase RutF
MNLTLSELPRLERYKLLIGLVIPRPIGWVSTWNENGVANCAPFSFFNCISEEPPLCILSFNSRTDGAMKHTLKNIHRTGEYVVNLVDESTANAMHISSYEIPETESEFAKTGLTPVPARLVKHPRIGEAAASFSGDCYRAVSIVKSKYAVRQAKPGEGGRQM